MDNGLVVLYFILSLIVVVGISFLIALLNEKYKHNKDAAHSRTANHVYYDNSWNWTKKDYSGVDAEIEEVSKWIGVSEPVDDIALVKKVIAGQEGAVVDEIARQLSLPMKVTIRHSNEHNPTKLAEVKVGSIPKYGSKHLELYPCTITFYPGYNSSPDRLISVIAHELSHYVLRSLRPSLPDEEKEERQTDLAVIFGGFKKPYNIGRKVYDKGTAGYLLDDEVDHIYGVYEAKLAKRRQQFKKISEDYSYLLKTQSDTLLFVEACGLLLEHPDEKILDDDMAPIGRCFSSVGKKEIERIKKLTASLDPFLKKRTRYGEMSKEKSDLAELKNILKTISLPEAQDISVLMKYIDRYNKV